MAAMEGIVLVVGHQGLLLRSPEHYKHRCGAHEKCVGAMIDVLSAEIPNDIGALFVGFGRKGANCYAMS